MKPYKTLREIDQACRKVDSCVAQSDSFMYKCFPFLLKLLVETNEQLREMTTLLKTVTKIQRKKEPSEYNLFIAEKRASGRSFEEAVRLWRERRQ